MSELLTTREVAAAYRLSERTVREWSKRGRLPCIRLGSRSIRYRAADVARALGIRPAAEAADATAGQSATEPASTPATA